MTIESVIVKPGQCVNPQSRHHRDEVTKCLTCGREWCNACTPVPSGRCPFEYEHHRSLSEAVVEIGDGGYTDEHAQTVTDFAKAVVKWDEDGLPVSLMEIFERFGLSEP